jgi:hypothetical protein
MSTAQSLHIQGLAWGAAAILFVSLTSIAFAEDGTASATGEASITVVSEPVEVVVDPATGQIIGNREPGQPKPPVKPPVKPGERMENAKDKMQLEKQQFNAAKDKMMGLKASTTEKMKDMRMDAKQRMMNASSSMREKMGSTSAREKFQEKRKELTEKAKERVKQFVEKTIKLLNAHHERLTKIVTRIDERLAKVKASGVSTTAIDTAVANAKAELGEADAAIGALETAFQSGTPATDEEGVRAHFAAMKDLAQTAREELREAHEAIRTALQAIKAAAEANTSASASLEN